jgi:hypothetical protein
MRFRSSILAMIGILGLTVPALADGFSATVDVPVLPTFSIGAGLHYSTEVIPNLFVGGSLNANFTPSFPASAQFGFGARAGVKYIVQVMEAKNGFVNVYVGAGLDLVVLPSVNVGSDLNAGVFTRYGISDAVKVYGGIDGELAFNFTASQFNPQISAYGGLKFEPIGALSLYTQAAIGFNGITTVNTGGAGFVYDARLGMYYDIVPQFRVGAYVGFNGGVVLGISGQYSLKPGTLAIPGNYLP